MLFKLKEEVFNTVGADISLPERSFSKPSSFFVEWKFYNRNLLKLYLGGRIMHIYDEVSTAVSFITYLDARYFFTHNMYWSFGLRDLVLERVKRIVAKDSYWEWETYGFLFGIHLGLGIYY